MTIVATIICLLYFQKFSLRVFRNMQHPIDFHQAAEGFYEELRLLVEEAAGAVAVALREFRPDAKRLEAIFAWNLAFKSNDVTNWNIEDIELFWGNGRGYSREESDGDRRYSVDPAGVFLSSGTSWRPELRDLSGSCW